MVYFNSESHNANYDIIENEQYYDSKKLNLYKNRKNTMTKRESSS
jgi:hypothetical protein